VARGDIIVLTADHRVVPNPRRTLGVPVVSLDNRFYKLIDRMEARFPFGAPSLVRCEKLEVRGDVQFGRNVAIRGRVTLACDAGAQTKIGDNTVLQG
jgi:UTP--glucose-1-phosphate uridylyltransferase